MNGIRNHDDVETCCIESPHSNFESRFFYTTNRTMMLVLLSTRLTRPILRSNHGADLSELIGTTPFRLRLSASHSLSVPPHSHFIMSIDTLDSILSLAVTQKSSCITDFWDSYLAAGSVASISIRICITMQSSSKVHGTIIVT